MPGSLFDLSGRVALVTGSTRGIGAVLADGLAQAGATVVLHGRDSSALEARHAELAVRVGSDRVHTTSFDVTDHDAVVGAVRRLAEETGGVDVLVNNAGVQHREPLLEVSVENFEKVLATNLTGPFLVGREVARGMVERGRGKIINIASVQSELARPTIGPYTAAKGGVRNLTRAMAAEWAGSGVQVNAIAPGYLETEMTAALVADEAFDAWLRGRTPAGRWGSPQDVVGPVVWLASAGSDYVSGQTIYVDGGMTIVV